jgi:ribosome-associated toxin RatA of RatAB toxin-antitoxin module
MHLPPFVPKNVLKKILFSKGQKITDRIKVKLSFLQQAFDTMKDTDKQADKQIRRRERN